MTPIREEGLIQLTTLSKSRKKGTVVIPVGNKRGRAESTKGNGERNQADWQGGKVVRTQSLLFRHGRGKTLPLKGKAGGTAGKVGRESIERADFLRASKEKSGHLKGGVENRIVMLHCQGTGKGASGGAKGLSPPKKSRFRQGGEQKKPSSYPTFINQRVT